MRPTNEELLRTIQTGVMTHAAPDVQANYNKAQLGFSALLFMVAGRDIESAVADLVEGNATLRSLLAELAAALNSIGRDDTRAGAATIAALPAAETSLRLSALRKENDALRAAIASLAPLIEPAGDDASLASLRDVRTKLYAHLSADAKRRIVPILSA